MALALLSSVLLMVGSLVFCLMVAGLIRPSIFVLGPRRTRGRSLLYYGVGCLALVSLGEAVKPVEVKEQEAQEYLKKGKRLFLAARWAYLSQDYQTAQDSAKEAASTLRGSRYRLPEMDRVEARVAAFMDSVEVALKHQKEDAKYITQRGTLARLVEQHAHQVYGRTVKQDGETIPSVMSVSAGYWAEVAYRVGPIWSVGTLRTSLMRDTRRFMERVFTDPECHKIEDIMVRPHNILVDKYGQNNEAQIGKLILSREVAAKINWAHLTDDMFERLLETEGQLWLHGSFYR